jgi:replicative DNA helicase
MSEAAEAEKSIVAMIGDSYSGVSEPVEEVEKFDFEADFQTAVAALVCRDGEFMRRASHLIKPDYFENVGEASLVNLVVQHYAKYRCIPDNVTTASLIRDAAKSGAIRKDVLPELLTARKKIISDALTSREYVEDKLAQFVRHQAVGAAIMKSVALRETGQFDKIEKLMKAAIEIGLNEDGDAYSYFDNIDERTEARLDIASGKRQPQGITTGVMKLDELLYHRGWGRKELASIMGGAKSGKTTALINFAKAASLAGHNVLYITLEVGSGIVSDRMDASLTETLMSELAVKLHHVREKVELARKKAGKLEICEYASGTMNGKMLRERIESYKSPGRNKDGSVRAPIKFDLVVVDYADIMAPIFRTNDAIENSKSVYVDLRAIAFEEDVAMLTATQTNREGHKATVALATHVSDDFNKVRTVDLMISINKTEEEARDGVARLYFAASRNQRSGFTVVVKQNLECMQFITGVLRIE